MIDENFKCDNIRIFNLIKNEPSFKTKTCLGVQKEFFLRDLISDNGKFLYYKRGIRKSGSTLVLFKYDNKIIASSMLKDVDHEPVIKHNVKHNGSLYLDVSTINVFEPIDKSQLANEIPNFNFIKRNLDIKYLEKIVKLINKNSKISYYKKLSM
ncbi:hypothetical protein [uncultured Clostridium sp.]|uniref:hypothetical protein n=1 Tax=uncultured Clostridium sp. TaxID=59620 RepID=UPI00272D044C|nr:hypothetical protein [uncultured Clostridium sp.]MCI9064207.1 hypothetical protein [Clostridia bacterium]